MVTPNTAPLNRRLCPSAKVLFVFALLVTIPLASGCQQPQEQLFQGYAEGEFVLVASPLGGRLEERPVARGEQVEQGGMLFRLERGAEQAEVSAAEQQLRRAQNQLADLEKGLRPSELAALRAQRDQARTALELAKTELDRSRALFTSEAIAKEALDRAEATWQQNRAAVDRLEADLKTAQLGARPDRVSAARAEVATARARLEKANWAFDQKQQEAPATGLIYDTLFEVGEYVPPGTPVVSLLPPDHLKLRFFVPEPLVGQLQPGQQIEVSYDGLAQPFSARISYISPQPEYTPPVIYSRASRSKLVFLIEARPDPSQARKLHPGQPVDVRLVNDHG